MKIAVTSTGPTLEDQVEARFGRCPYFLLVDTESMDFEVIENPNIALGGGAGIQSAQMMAEKRVSHVLTGNCGPNAFQVFGQVGVSVVVGVTGCAREAVERFKAGEFVSASAANVESHFGMGAGGGQPQASNMEGPGSPMGMRGMGMGRRGGMGRGRGTGFGMGWSPWAGSQGFGSMHGAGESFQINQRIPEPAEARTDGPGREPLRADVATGAAKRLRKAVALVQTQKCGGCGICVDVCPTGAMRVDGQAVVDPALCTACAACVAECPNEAVIIVQRRA